jgi:cyclic pyranopterin phosphate synthase
MSDLSHLDESGRARMVDVTHKADTHRTATAQGVIVMLPTTLHAIRRNEVGKGDVIAAARIAGIMAAKKTSEIIPLCHPLMLSRVDIELQLDDNLPGVRVEATVECVGKTGVEMEALVATSAALLTIYDMTKAVDRGMVISEIALLVKSGGQSGEWRR